VLQPRRAGSYNRGTLQANSLKRRNFWTLVSFPAGCRWRAVHASAHESEEVHYGRTISSASYRESGEVYYPEANSLKMWR
jgi:hypothetical protein